MLLTPQVDDLLTDGFHHIIDEREFPRWDPLMGRYFMQRSSTKPDENVSEITGYGLMQIKTEAGAVTYDDIMQAYDTTFTHDEYVLASEVSEIVMEDDQYSKIETLPGQLFTSFDETIEIIAANHLNRGFNPLFTGGDGIELFSRLHPLQGGGFFTNEPSAQADLSASSYEQARIDIAGWTDHRAKKLRFRPQKLIHPPDLDWTVDRLFRSEKDPESAMHAVNPANKLQLESISNPYLTDTDAWFIQCNKHYMDWWWRRRIRTGRDNDFQTANFRFKIDFRASSGWESPFGMYASAGG